MQPIPATSPLIYGPKRPLQDTSICRHTSPERIHQHKCRLLERYDETGQELPELPRDARDTLNDK
jgi:hypothetical protein